MKMSNTPSESQTIDRRGPPAAEASLWDRLRENIRRLSSIDRQNADPEAVAQRLAARAKMLRSRDAADASSPCVFLGFSKGRERYGILLEDVLEVDQLEHFSAVPKTPPFIRGVIHWRGAILSLLDLGDLFGVPESGLADLHFCVIVEAGGRRVAIAAREIEDIFSVPRENVKPAPELQGNIRPQWVLGVTDENRVLLRMDQLLQDERLVNWRNR